MSTSIVVGLLAAMLYWLVRANLRLDQIIEELYNEGDDESEVAV